jgi:ribA/ribD-fused uncharacterized protein
MPVGTRRTSVKMSEELLISVKSMQDNISKMNESILALTGEVVGLKDQVGKFTDVKDSLEHTQAEYEETKSDILLLKDQNTKLESNQQIILKKLKEVQQENKQLSERLLKLDTYIRRENLKFCGISEENNETSHQCQKKIYDLFQNQLELANSNSIEFQRCHRMGKREAGKNRDIIVRFVRYGNRELVWGQKTKLKGTQFIIKEDFPPEIENRRSRLFPIYKAAVVQKKKASLVADNLYIDGRKYTVDTLDALPDSLLPKTLAVRKIGKAVMFHGRDAVFSNFYNSVFIVDGKQYNSTEQYFQFQRATVAGYKESAEKIMQASDPAEQHRIGRKLGLDTSGWNNDTAKQVMTKGVQAKFEQNQTLKDALLDTNDDLLIECNKYEKFWANGLSLHDINASQRGLWKGQNALGEILISVRENLK